jgi:hypothetical protein
MKSPLASNNGTDVVKELLSVTRSLRREAGKLFDRIHGTVDRLHR